MFMLNVENKLFKKKVLNLSFVLIDEAVDDFDSRIWIISLKAAWKYDISLFHECGNNFMKLNLL